MPIGHSLPRRVAVHLESYRPCACDLVSLSKGGWGQREELEALERYGPRLQLDRVVPLFTARNDPLNNARDLPGHEENLRLRGQMLEDGRAWSRGFRADQAVGLWFPRSALNRLISHRMSVEEGPDRLRSAHALFDGVRFDVDLPDRRLAQLCAELG